MGILRILSLLLASQEIRQAPGLKDAVEARKTPPIEQRDGLAAKYPGDVGIDKDPEVVFAEVGREIVT
ncbi:MAG TPA: hypothetical protein VE981_03595 [Planctomycetota bacterium]|nr:hypothetical protein [Planctomycetota bacterium]